MDKMFFDTNTENVKLFTAAFEFDGDNAFFKVSPAHLEKMNAWLKIPFVDYALKPQVTFRKDDDVHNRREALKIYAYGYCSYQKSYSRLNK